MTSPAHPLRTFRPLRHLRLLVTLAIAACCLTAPALASAQSLLQPPQTKEEAERAREEAQQSASSDGEFPLELVLAIVGLGLLAGAAWWIIRDAGDAVGGNERAAPDRPLDRDAVGRGAPRTMFTGDAEPGGKVGKRKKRDAGRRQRQARKANRPR